MDENKKWMHKKGWMKNEIFKKDQSDQSWAQRACTEVQ